MCEKWSLYNYQEWSRIWACLHIFVKFLTPKANPELPPVQCGIKNAVSSERVGQEW